MVRFFQKVGEIARGESPEEGQERRDAESRIRRKTRAIGFQAKEEQAIILEKKKQEIIHKARERKLQQRFAPRPRPQPFSFGAGTSSSDPLGLGMGISRPSLPSVKRVSRKTKRKNKKSRRFQQSATQPSPQKKFDILGF